MQHLTPAICSLENLSFLSLDGNYLDFQSTFNLLKNLKPFPFLPAPIPMAKKQSSKICMEPIAYWERTEIDFESSGEEENPVITEPPATYPEGSCRLETINLVGDTIKVFKPEEICELLDFIF